MKKLIALTLALLTLTMCFAACDNQANDNTAETTPAVNTPAETTPAVEETTPAPELAYNSAIELLQIIFEKYNAAQTSEDTMLWVCGGNVNNFDTVNAEAPAAFVALDNEDYNQNLGYPVAEANKIVSAASMFNMMNANTFTCYTVQLTEGTDVDAMANTLKDNILARQWICGQPEKLVIAKAPGNYLIVTWGVSVDGGIVLPYTESFATLVPGSEIVVTENIG